MLQKCIKQFDGSSRFYLLKNFDNFINGSNYIIRCKSFRVYSLLSYIFIHNMEISKSRNTIRILSRLCPICLLVFSTMMASLAWYNHPVSIYCFCYLFPLTQVFFCLIMMKSACTCVCMKCFSIENGYECSAQSTSTDTNNYVSLWQSDRIWHPLQFEN